jgi:tRNA threonylcarbamoyladenosine modification (KEOPS) complex  Pcc1 subunit
MKASFSLDFKSEADARRALEVFGKGRGSAKGSQKAKRRGKSIDAEIGSDSFTGLRALSTGFLRAARLVYDVIERIEAEESGAANEKIEMKGK